MIVLNEKILEDRELTKFMEELEGFNMPSCFEDINYIPTQEEIKTFSNEELEYLSMTVNEDESDAIYDGGALYEKAHNRCLLVKSMINEELKRRNEV